MKQQGFVLESDTSAPRAVSQPPKPQATGAKATPLKPQTLADMKSELFGSSDSAGVSERRPRKQRVEEREGGYRTPEHSGRDEESRRYSEEGSQVTMESRLEDEGREEEEEEEEKSDKEEDDNLYGGMLT